MTTKQMWIVSLQQTKMVQFVVKLRLGQKYMMYILEFTVKIEEYGCISVIRLH